MTYLNQNDMTYQELIEQSINIISIASHSRKATYETIGRFLIKNHKNPTKLSKKTGLPLKTCKDLVKTWKMMRVMENKSKNKIKLIKY